jgi:hypothetical protein
MGTGGVAIVPIAVPANGTASGAASFAIDPAVHPLGTVVTQSFPLAVAPVPLCAPPPTMTVSVRPVDRAIDFDSTGSEGTLCAVGHTHRAYCMGSNLYAQILAGPPYSYEPITLVKNVSADVVGVSPGSTCFAKGATLVCRTLDWQNNGNTPFPPPWTTTFSANVARIRGRIQVVTGYQASYLVLLTNGTSYGVGYGGDGIFGVPNPQSMVGPGPFLAMGGLNDVVDVALGSNHACIVRAGGTVACSGYGTWGQVVPGAMPGSPYEAPTTVSGVSATQLALSQNRSCALRPNGAVACWGSTWSSPYVTPVPVTDMAFPQMGRTSVATSAAFLGALRTQGDVDGFLDGTGATFHSPVAAGSLLRPGLNMTSPAVFRHAICAMEPGGRIYCFGGPDVPGYLGGFD